ncbi:MAG: hypothetical protein KDD58_15610 [Bdellovibrionales bacterium]|nr:hypothetical protein [Bdellovibrionales bacterium]
MKIGILNAYHFDKTPGVYQEKYMPMLFNFLNEYWPEAIATEYKVAQNNFPQSEHEQQLWLITGSPLSAYDNIAWINQLKEFIVNANSSKSKLIGLCFGHQIIAEALGGKVEKSQQGWGVGVRNFQIIKNKPWMTPQLTQCSLLFSHQDQVINLPHNAELLATDEFCPNQMYSIDRHIFCMQGHPEFTADYAKERLDTRVEKVGSDRYKLACSSLGQTTQSKEIWTWIKNFSSY